MLKVLDLSKESATMMFSRSELQTIYKAANVISFTAAHHQLRELHAEMSKLRDDVKDVLNSMDTADLPY